MENHSSGLEIPPGNFFIGLNREEASKYLKHRADNGFTVIQAVVLADLDGLHEPNPYGEIPLENDDPTKPREPYFQHVDFIVRKAAELNLYIGMLPTWGDKIFKDRWGTGPEIFTEENARIYGKWIGNRYKNDKNIIWILGGDRNPRNERDVAIWRSMAAGIEEAVGRDNALMTFHPQPTGVQDGGSAKVVSSRRMAGFQYASRPGIAERIIFGTELNMPITFCL